MRSRYSPRAAAKRANFLEGIFAKCLRSVVEDQGGLAQFLGREPLRLLDSCHQLLVDVREYRRPPSELQLVVLFSTAGGARLG